MKFHWTSSKTRWKDSLTVSLAILTTIQTLADVTGILDNEVYKGLDWWIKLLCIALFFIILLLIIFIVKQMISRSGVKLIVADNEVHIKQADIFNQNGLRLIPFNENFDTVVDDVIIAHKTLNGMFIDHHVEDIAELNNTIRNAPKVPNLNIRNSHGKTKFELGRIIRFHDYLLLAFTRFNKNNYAYLSHNDFERCLLTMWKEIERVYANKPIFLPLLGSGITRFTDTPHKDNSSLIKCLLCTLKMSGVHIKKPITICLTEDTLSDINIYELKS